VVPDPNKEVRAANPTPSPAPPPRMPLRQQVRLSRATYRVGKFFAHSAGI